jgi:hypothetical protein
VTDRFSSHDVNGLKLRLTRAGADYVTAARRHKPLVRDVGSGTLELRLLEPAASGIRSGAVRLGGGLSIAVPGVGTAVTMTDPELVVGAMSLYANVDGERIKIGDVDPDALELDLADGSVAVKRLTATVSGQLAPLLNQLLGVTGIQAGTPLRSLPES